MGQKISTCALCQKNLQECDCREATLEGRGFLILIAAVGTCLLAGLLVLCWRNFS